MKKLTMLTFAALFAVTAASQTPDTDWYVNVIADNPEAKSFTVSNADELAGLAAIVNGTWGGEPEKDEFSGKTITLAADVDLAGYAAGEGWKPIGVYTGVSTNMFRGTFNGGGHVISNMTINRIDGSQGFFGFISRGRVDGLRLVDVNISASSQSGSVAGQVFDSSRVTNCYSTGTVSGGSFTGGIVGHLAGGSIVENSYFSGTVSDIFGNSGYIGGIVGQVNNSSLSNCYSNGEVRGTDRMGGVVGYVYYADIDNCYSTSAVSGNRDVGGIAGYLLGGRLTNCAALNSEVKSDEDVSSSGRVVGYYHDCTLSNNFAYSGIKDNAGNISWPNKDNAGGRNGKDIGSTAFPITRDVGGLFTAAVWTTGDGALPGLFGKTVAMPAHLLITVNNAEIPAILTQSANDMVTTGYVHSISVTASVSDGGELSYQWYSTTSGIMGTHTKITGATNSSYTVPTSVLGTHYYFVEVTNTNAGLNGETTVSATSDIITVIVIPVINAAAPAITAQPLSGTVTVGSSHSISVTASVSDGGTRSYQWYKNTTASADGGTAVTGATDSYYSVPTSIEGTYYYYVVVTNTNNDVTGEKTAAVTSDVAAITVNVPPPLREITVLMRDSYGDGWNGANLRINVNGTNLSPNAALSSGSSGTYKFSVYAGDVVMVYWNARGTYPDECAFAMYYSDEPPSVTFNPASGAANNDIDALLLHRLYGSLSTTAAGTLLGSFTAAASGPRVSVSPQTVSLPPGGMQTFTAKLINIDYPGVSWRVTGKNHAGTDITSGGVLTISASETANTLTVTATSDAYAEVFSSATVTVIQPYKIGTAAELAAFADSINSGRNFTGRIVVLTADIDLSDYSASNTTFNSGRGWIPIGTASYPFRGEFNGNGHVIRNLYINNASRDYAGLFGQIGSTNATGAVKNLGLDNVNIRAGSYAGGVAGLVRGYGANVGSGSQIDYASEVTNCYVTGSVKGVQYIGGIAGSVSSWGLANYCYSTAEISGSTISGGTVGPTYTGGIAGVTDGEILNCAALNSSVKGGTYVGRIVGYKTDYASLSNNAAYDEMLNSSDTYTWSSKGLTTVNGADISASDINTDGTLGGRFDHAPWVTAKGFLPAFGVPAVIPDHISNEPAAVTAVIISPSGAAVRRGTVQTIQFSAVVEGTRRPAQTVTWSVSGGGAGTSISAGGLLTVSAGETAASLTVKAVSVLDDTKFGTASVAFVDGADMSNPAAYHGRLSVKGNRIYNQHGDTVQLRGMSFFWSMAGEGREYYNANVVNRLADDWKVNVVRAAMGVNEVWIDRTATPFDTMAGYISGDKSGGVSNKKRLTDVVDAAIEKGIYAIIDWHSHRAHANTASAVTFFQEMAEKYKGVPNVLYEIYNEPCDPLAGGEECGGNSWGTHIKPYLQTVVDAIRAVDSNNIIILGTPTWSQDVDAATLNPVVGKNLVYSLHFYAASHGASLRSQATAALNRGYAVFVSEFGTCRADGAGSVDTAATNTWLNFLDQHKISWVNWSIANKAEAASALWPSAGINGNWTASDLRLSGTYIRGKLIKAAESEFFAAPKTLKYSAGANGSIIGETEQTVKVGANGAAVTALADSGYEFIRWSDNSTENPRQDKNVMTDLTVTAVFEKPMSTLSSDRNPSDVKRDKEELSIAPLTIFAGEFTVGPNPAVKQSGTVNLFWQGKRIQNAALTIFDASGNIVNKKVLIKDDYGAQARRPVGLWDLTDTKGRPVAGGTYLLKGVITTSDGNREKISIIIGVR